MNELNYMFMLNLLSSNCLFKKKSLKITMKENIVFEPEIRKKFKYFEKGDGIGIYEIQLHSLGFIDALLWLDEKGLIDHSKLEKDGSDIPYDDLYLIYKTTGIVPPCGKAIKQLFNESKKIQ